MSASACSGTCTMNFALPAGACVSACCTASRQSADRSQRRRESCSVSSGSCSKSGVRQQPVQPHTLPPQPVCQCRILHLLGLGHQSTQITRAFVLNDPQAAVIGGTVAPQIRQQCTAAVRDHFDRVDRSVDVLLCGAGRLCLCTGAVYSACCRSGTDPAPPSGADRKAAVPRRCTARYAAYRSLRTAPHAAARYAAAARGLRCRPAAKKMRLPSLSSQNTV